MSKGANVFANLKLQKLLNQYGDLQKTQATGDKNTISVCPFKVILGATNATEAGYKSLNAIAKDYTQFSRVFDGNEAFVVRWIDSIKDNALNQTYEGNPPDDNDYGAKDGTSKYVIQKGKEYKGNILSEGLTTQFVPYSANSGFTSQEIVSTIRIRFYPENKTNEDFFTNIEQVQLNLFVIPQFGNLNPSREYNPLSNTDRNFFYINNTNIERDINKNILYIEVEFKSLLSELSKTGKSINNYAQLGAPGEVCGFPTLDSNNNIVLDPLYLIPRPATHFEVLFRGNVGLSNLSFLGREVKKDDIVKNKDNTYTINTPATNLVFPFNFLGTPADTFSLRKTPDSVYGWPKQFRFEIDSFATLKDTINIQYNQISQRNNVGVFAYDKIDPDDKGAATEDSNRNKNKYWDNDFLTTDNWTLSNNYYFPIEGNKYFNYNFNEPTTGKTALLTPSEFTYQDSSQKNFLGFKMDRINNKNFSNFNMFNYLINDTLAEIPLQINDDLKIALNNIPVFGDLGRKFTFGLIDGFTLTNQTVPKFSYYNCIIPRSLYTNYGKIFAIKDPTTEATKFPFETFYDSSEGVGGILGTTGQTCSFGGTLTNNIKLQKYDITDGPPFSLLKNGDLIIRKTRELNQYFTPNAVAKQIYFIDYKSELVAREILKDNVIGYYIDGINIDALAKCDIQIKFFYDPNNIGNQPLNNDDCIYIAEFKSNSKSSNAIRQNKITRILNDPTMKQDKPYRYPQNVEPTPPNNVPQFKETVDLTGLYDNKTYYQTTIKKFDKGGKEYTKYGAFVPSDFRTSEKKTPTSTENKTFGDYIDTKTFKSYSGYKPTKIELDISTQWFRSLTGSNGPDLPDWQKTDITQGAGQTITINKTNIPVNINFNGQELNELQIYQSGRIDDENKILMSSNYWTGAIELNITPDGTLQFTALNPTIEKNNLDFSLYSRLTTPIPSPPYVEDSPWPQDITINYKIQYYLKKAKITYTKD